MKFRFDSLIQSDIDLVNDQAAWTEDQKKMFEKLLHSQTTDAGIMQELCISNNRRYYQIKGEIRKKIDRILHEKRT